MDRKRRSRNEVRSITIPDTNVNIIHSFMQRHQLYSIILYYDVSYCSFEKSLESGLFPNSNNSWMDEESRKVKVGQGLGLAEFALLSLPLYYYYWLSSRPYRRSTNLSYPLQKFGFGCRDSYLIQSVISISPLRRTP